MDFQQRLYACVGSQCPEFCIYEGYIPASQWLYMAVYGFFKAIFDLLKSKPLCPDAIAVAFEVFVKD